MLDHGKIILDLCGGTGAWSKPYVDAGYDVRLVTLPDQDVRLYVPPAGVYGVLAAPPCTHLASCGARVWKTKGQGALLDGLAIVDACLCIIMLTRPAWWALENPIGRLSQFMGQAVMIFDPSDYGDPWTKKTCLWGRFAIPVKCPVDPQGKSKGANAQHNKPNRCMTHIQQPPLLDTRAAWRAVTPPGFAKAFFEANR